MRKWWEPGAYRCVGATVAAATFGWTEGPVRVLVVGGSQGARILNQQCRRLLRNWVIQSLSGIRAERFATIR